MISLFVYIHYHFYRVKVVEKLYLLNVNVLIKVESRNI